MSDYQNRNRQGYDVKQVLLAEQTFVGSVVTGAGVHIGENVNLNIRAIRRGAIGNADNVLAITVEESSDNSSFTTLQAMATLTDGNVSQSEVVRTTKPYIRAKTAAVTGTTPSLADVEVFIES